MKRLFMLMMVFAAFGSTLSGQQQTSKKEERPSAESSTFKEQAAPVYKLAFGIYELQGGKRINERDYSVLLRADNNSNKLKIGTRVPIDIGEGKITYADVGFDMECSVVETADNKVGVRLDITVTNFAIPEQNANPGSAGNRPVLRGVTERVRTVLIPGKPQIVTSMDDVNSTKRMQVEVTATKVD